MPPAKRGPEPVVVSRETRAIAAVERREASVPIARDAGTPRSDPGGTCVRRAKGAAQAPGACRRSAPLISMEGSKRDDGVPGAANNPGGEACARDIFNHGGSHLDHIGVGFAHQENLAGKRHDIHSSQPPRRHARRHDAARVRRAARRAQTAHNLKIVVPYPPASGPDILSRLMAEQIGRVQNATVVVENRPGGGTMIGTQAAARAARRRHRAAGGEFLRGQSGAEAGQLRRGHELRAGLPARVDADGIVVKGNSPYKTAERTGRRRPRQAR